MNEYSFIKSTTPSVKVENALDPNQLDLFSQEDVSAKERAEAEEEARQADRELTKAIRPKAKPAANP